MQTRTVAELELSAAAYDEIERKLLEAGYDHLFAQGPGSAIDLAGIAVTREVDVVMVDREVMGKIAAQAARRPDAKVILATEPYVAPDHDPA